jgi:hypothetical protein
LNAAIHVHTTCGKGAHTLEELAVLAEKEGVDVLVPSDQLLSRATYGLFPLRNVVKRSAVEPALFDYGVAAYLDLVEAVQRKHPKLVLVPGAEVRPFYYWKGSLLRGNLELHRFDHHMLLVGKSDPAFYENVPMAGNPRNRRWTTRSYMLLWPAPVALVALALLRRGHRRGRGRRRAAGVLLLAVCAVALWNNQPFSTARWGPFDGPQGTAPFQEVIDYARAGGALVFWNHPEAWRSPYRKGPVTLVASRHADDLVHTRGYTGFEALYGDHITATRPGGEWDQALAAYCRGEREQPPWGTTGLDLYRHNPKKGWGTLDAGATVILAKERSRAAVLEALREGAFYAVHGQRTIRYSLETMRVGGKETLPGAQCAWKPGDRLEVVLRVAGKQAYRGRLVVVRNGQAWQSMDISVPGSYGWTLEEPGEGTRDFYRLVLTGPRGTLLTNPVFVQRTAAKPSGDASR